MQRVLLLVSALLVAEALCASGPRLAWSRQLSANPVRGAIAWKDSIVVLADVTASLSVATGSVNWITNTTLNGVPGNAYGGVVVGNYLAVGVSGRWGALFQDAYEVIDPTNGDVIATQVPWPQLIHGSNQVYPFACPNGSFCVMLVNGTTTLMSVNGPSWRPSLAQTVLLPNTIPEMNHGAVPGALSARGDTLFFSMIDASGEQSVQAFHGVTLVPKWKTTLAPGGQLLPQLISNGSVVYALLTQNVVALQQHTGEVLWRSSASNLGGLTPDCLGLIDTPLGGVLTSQLIEPFALVLLNATTGENVVPPVNVTGDVLGACNGIVLAQGNFPTTIQGYHPLTGRLLWQVKTVNAVQWIQCVESSAVISKGGVLVADQQGSVWYYTF